MKQIKLDKTHDIAIDGNEVWIIDYSKGLHNPRPGQRHQFCFSPVTVEKIEPSGNDKAIINYLVNGQPRISIVHISESFITFTDPDAPRGRHEDGTPATAEDIEKIERDYLSQLEEICQQFEQDAVERERPENRDTIDLIELKKKKESHIHDVTLQHFRRLRDLTG